MPQAGSKGMLLISMAVMAVVLCGALAVMTEYAKTEYKVKKGPDQTESGPSGPFAAKIKDLKFAVYDVTQAGHDETPADGKYVRTNDPGLYVDVVSSEVLFSSLDKVDSTRGYAEFSKPFDPLTIVEKEEKSVDSGELRTQVRSKAANSYLGWVVNDPSGSRRYVINSNALILVPPESFEKYGLGRHRELFEKTPPGPPQGNGTPP
jgi:methionine-R-sulfoxide reductase